MQRYTNEQRISMVQCYYRAERNVAQAVRHYNTKYDIRGGGPNPKTIVQSVNRFESTGSEHDNTDNIGRPTTVFNEENMKNIQQLIRNNPRISIRQIEGQTKIFYGSIRTILKCLLGMFPYEVQLQQALTTQHIETRKTFANEII
ncbi:histone-lysine N-methyltransferase SETMAR-like protein [Leptotrombidium deliense]|uniref:Histone-lysine N-methyltransferase SETMAR-like protein n=1 Tax=Leptotrombidium deliense TaxID=299467 RepID=A0A443RUX0_9ACAR|nr:histone-lysine N-methyltransferase SETMAR-like protein [Leptotrombidium deliense]